MGLEALTNILANIAAVLVALFGIIGIITSKKQKNIKSDNIKQDIDVIANNLFFCNNAKGLITNNGFILLKGSKIVDNNPKYIWAKKLREEHKNSINIDQTLKKDILLSSSSAAAAFVLGYYVNGKDKWKTENNKTLKEILKELQK